MSAPAPAAPQAQGTTAESAIAQAAAAAADPAIQPHHHARARELLTLAFGVGITRNQSAALMAAKLAGWDADYESVLADTRRLAREMDVAMFGEDGAARHPSLCDVLASLRDLVAQRDQLGAQLQQARDYVAQEIFKGQIGAGEDPVGNLIAICESLRAARGGQSATVRLAQWALERAKRRGCGDEGSWDLLQRAADLGVGNVRWVTYNPRRHGPMEDVEPGNRVLFWGEERDWSEDELQGHGT